MFFEPVPTTGQTAHATGPTAPAWLAPSSLEVGALLPVERVVARSDNVVVRLPIIRAFRTGCALNVEIVCRQGELSPDDWQKVRAGAQLLVVRDRPKDRVPDELLRFGVRYADGTKATTIGQNRPLALPADDPPRAPALSWAPSGGGPHVNDVFDFRHFWLWLWPLPPPEKIEFATEWPLGGIELTIIDLEGAAIQAAAQRSADFWQNLLK